jgi:hypothetical protein
MDTIQAGFDCSDFESPMGETGKNALRIILTANLNWSET